MYLGILVKKGGREGGREGGGREREKRLLAIK
jgi:hypothetical protein